MAEEDVCWEIASGILDLSYHDLIVDDERLVRIMLESADFPKS